jgi:hypothetical protein
MASLLEILRILRNTVMKVRSVPFYCLDSLKMYRAKRPIGRLREYQGTPLQTQSEVPVIDIVFKKTTIRKPYGRTND